MPIATSNFRIKSGDSLPVIDAILESRTNKPISEDDLDHLSTVEFQLYPLNNLLTAEREEAATLIDATRALFRYAWPTPAPAAKGLYAGYFVLTFDNGNILTVPNANDGVDLFIVEVT